MKKIWAVRKDSEAVSPVIATILMVAITVVLAAVLYVMVLGFGADTTTTPTATLNKTSVTDGWRFSVAGISEEVNWEDVVVTVIQGTNAWSWDLSTATATDYLSNGTATLGNFGAVAGTPDVTLKIMDLTGNGKCNGGDFIELTTETTGEVFSGSLDYEFRLIYSPTSTPMNPTTSFSG